MWGYLSTTYMGESLPCVNAKGTFDCDCKQSWPSILTFEHHVTQGRSHEWLRAENWRFWLAISIPNVPWPRNHLWYLKYECTTGQTKQKLRHLWYIRTLYSYYLSVSCISDYICVLTTSNNCLQRITRNLFLSLNLFKLFYHFQEIMCDSEMTECRKEWKASFIISLMEISNLA